MRTVFISLFFFCTLVFPGILPAQEDAYVPADMDKRKIVITSAATSGSILLHTDRYSDLETFRSRYETRSAMLKNDFSGFKTDQVYNINWQNKLSIQVGCFPFRKPDTRETFQKEIRSEISYVNGEIRSLSLFNTIKRPGDTLNFQGQLLHSDTVIDQQYNFAEQADGVSISSAFIFTSPAAKRIHFSGGAGFELGGSVIYTGFTGAYTEYVSVTYKNQIGETINEDNLGSNTQTETFSINPYYYARLFFPVSMELRLSKKNELMKHFYLFLHACYGLDFVTGNGTHNSRVSVGYGSGIRYRIFTP